MTKIRDLMTPDVEPIQKGDSLQHAAQRMDELNVGALPVCEGRKLVGMITDRDITVRAIAAGLSPQDTQVCDVMTEPPRCCHADESVDDVMRQMGEVQIRRLPVLDADDRLCGIVSLGDLARETTTPAAEQALEGVSAPGGQHQQ